MNFMKTFLTLTLALASTAAAAQTPAINPMPDGSRDMYVGLGVAATPRYEGARERTVRLLPVIQVEWSNGVFISGMSAGMHLSNNPSLEFGPLLALKSRRSESGEGRSLLGANVMGGNTLAPPNFLADVPLKTDNRLAGMEPIGARLQAGAFLNYYVRPDLRLTNSVLAGAGHDRNGALWNVNIQQLAAPITLRHTVALSAGLTFANRRYNESYFGVRVQESFRGRNIVYSPEGGLNDVHAGVRWNWTLSPSWLLTSNVRVTRMTGSIKNSPLIERPTNVSVSTGLAYRF